MSKKEKEEKTPGSWMEKWGSQVMDLSKKKLADIDVISTRSISLDKALGVGGVPRGRITELYGAQSGGKTSVCLHLIAEAQSKGLKVLFVDAENAFDPTWAAKLGVQVEELILVQPDSGEAGLNIVLDAVKSNVFGLIVVDSVTALVPQAEIDGDVGDNHVGRHPRMMGQGIKKINVEVRDANCAVVFINQTRMKIGVMFGCFQYHTPVTLADGTTEWIGKIVNQKMPVEVLSFNPETGVCEPKKVVGWHDNGNAEQFLHFVTESCGGGGTYGFACTENHHVYSWDPSSGTPSKGWRFVEAGSLRVGDFVAGKGLWQFHSDWLRQLALASVLGDGSLQPTGRNSVQLRIGHGADQLDYCRWKAAQFGDCVRWSGPTGRDGWGFDCRPSVDLVPVYREAYSDNGGRVLSKTVLRELDLRGVAVWYMDDGTFSGSYGRWGNGKSEISAKSYSSSERELLADRLEQLGLPRPTVTSRGLLWSGKACGEFQAAIARHVHPSMDYKIHPSLRGRFVEPEVEERADYFVMAPVRVTDIYTHPPTRSMRKFDLTVEGNSTYLVGGGVGVHNSPVTTTGGEALKFFASVRLEVAGIEKLKDGENVIGKRTRVKVVKNKISPPHKEAEFDFLFDRGIHREAEVFDLALEAGKITKTGNTYSFGDTKLGVGRKQALASLENAELFDTLRKAVV